MMGGDSSEIHRALAAQMKLGYRTGFVTAAALAGTVAMSKTGSLFQNTPGEGFFAPSFSKGGRPLDMSQVPAHIALAGQMMVAVANDDMDTEAAVFNSAIKLGPEIFTGFMAELVTRATKAIQEAKNDPEGAGSSAIWRYFLAADGGDVPEGHGEDL
jgi:hypothetical protein